MWARRPPHHQREIAHPVYVRTKNTVYFGLWIVETIEYLLFDLLILATIQAGNISTSWVSTSCNDTLILNYSHNNTAENAQSTTRKTCQIDCRGFTQRLIPIQLRSTLWHKTIESMWEEKRWGHQYSSYHFVPFELLLSFLPPPEFVDRGATLLLILVIQNAECNHGIGILSISIRFALQRTCIQFHTDNNQYSIAIWCSGIAVITR